MAPAQFAGRSMGCGACGAEVQIPEAVAATEPAAASGQTKPRSGPVYKQAHAKDESDDISRQELRSRRKRRQRAARSSEGGSQKKHTWWLRSLLFPFRKESLITIAILASLFGTFSPFAGLTGRIGVSLLVGKAGPIIAVLVIGYFVYFLLDVLRTAAKGEEDLPTATDWSPEETLLDLFLATGTFAVCYLPWGVYRMFLFWKSLDSDIFVESVLLGLSTLYFPMALLSATIHGSFLAVNPVTVLRAIGLTWLDYVIVLALIAVGVLLGYGVTYLMAGSLLMGTARWWGMFTGMTMAMHALGSLYRRNSFCLAWIRESQ